MWKPPTNLTHADDAIAEFHWEDPGKLSLSNPITPLNAKQIHKAPLEKEATTQTWFDRISRPRVNRS